MVFKTKIAMTEDTQNPTIHSDWKTNAVKHKVKVQYFKNPFTS